MSGHGKRLNIWIAYSDLFTNLSTFLFVSALGLFATIGSGVVSSFGFGAGGDPCPVPTEIEQSMITPTSAGDQSLLIPIIPAVPLKDCRRYYRIGVDRVRSAYFDPAMTAMREWDADKAARETVLAKFCGWVWLGSEGLVDALDPTNVELLECRKRDRVKYQFRSYASGIGEYRIDGSGRSLTVENIYAEICAPMWRTIGLAEFESRDGKLNIYGMGSEDNTYPYQPYCGKINRNDEPRTDNLAISTLRSKLDVIARCENDEKDTSSICTDVRRCKRPNLSNTSTCINIAAIKEFHIAANRQCLSKSASLQAQTIFNKCAKLYEKPRYFPDDDMIKPNMSATAQRPETRFGLWWRAGFNGYVKSAPFVTTVDEQTRMMLEGQPAGSIVVEIKLEPPKAKTVN